MLQKKWPGTYCMHSCQQFCDIYCKVVCITLTKHMVISWKMNADEIATHEVGGQGSSVGLAKPFDTKAASKLTETP